MPVKQLALIFFLFICTPLALAGQATEPVNTPDFIQWQQQFRQKAINEGIPQKLLDQAFAGMHLERSTLQADANQPEHIRPVWQYLQSAISSWRVARGKALLAEHRRTLDAIEARYQVDRHILVAIWGLESNYGRQMGDRPVIHSLATLAFAGRRAEFWEQQIIAALKIVLNGDITLENLRGSWAGAMGQTQFIPTTYLTYAVDFDGDGRRDIWGSPADALASAANYLQKSGWQTGQRWGYEVQLPTLFNHSLADGQQRKSLQQWLDFGVSLRQPQSLDTETLKTSASIFLPAGYHGPAYLQLDNFRAILKYNQATSYALAVGLLADSLQGYTFTLHRWPQDDTPLTRSERLELQRLLNRLGLSAGAEDGIIGAGSRSAIRQFQLEHDLPADGYPSGHLLEKLRDTQAND